MKKIVLFFLTLMCILSLGAFTAFSEDVASGSCGKNLTWTLDTNGVLIVNGTGAMDNWTRSGETPWYSVSGSIKKVVIKSGVTTVGDCAFMQCSNLTTATLPGSVTTLGESSFRLCENMTSIKMASGLTTIKAYAFRNNTVLNNVVLPDSVTTLGDQVFVHCEGMTNFTMSKNITNFGESMFEFCAFSEITIPEGITTIPRRTFYGCYSLSEITLHDNITAIGEDAFFNTAYYLNPQNWTDGVFYIGKFLVDVESDVTQCVIREGTSFILPSAFYNCTSLTSITIPDSITAISDSAFRNCISLKNITFPDSITTIGASSFMGCTSLKTITIPENITKIGGQAFQGCTALTRINWNAKNVNNFGATNYTFSKSGQKSTGIDVIFGENVETIPSYLLYPGNEEYAPNIASITMGNNIKTIGESAFRGLSNIVSITIPENVTSIGKHAFQDCLSVETIYWNAKEVINMSGSNYVFANCGKYTSGVEVIFGDNVEKISPNTFFSAALLEEAPYITHLVLPENIKSIGNGAFENCFYLTEITIPKSVTSIQNFAFYKCTNLETIYWNAVNAAADSEIQSSTFDRMGSDTPSGTKIVFGDSVEIIPKSAFWTFNSDNIPYITSVEIGESVKTIGVEAFIGCKYLTEITIPDSVTAIGKKAFEECSGLTDVVIGNGVTEIKNRTFYLCSELRNVELGENISSIGKEAFYKCENLESITIPENVTFIDEYAFFFCKGLKKINWNAKNISDFSFQNSIFTCAGRNAYGIEVIFGDSVEHIPAYAFYPYNTTETAPYIVSVIIGDNVKTIGESAFSFNVFLEDLYMGNSVIHIGYDAFYNCNSLSEVHIDDVRLWCDIVFDDVRANPLYFSENLYINGQKCENIVIPSGVKSIKKFAFYNFRGMKHITLPMSLETVGSNAFHNCSNLFYVKYMGNEAKWKQLLIEEYNEPLVNADITYVLGTTTSVTQGGKKLKVNPDSAINGDIVILVLYNGNSFLDMQIGIYEGEELEFTVNKNYTEVKALVWRSLQSLKPVCPSIELE